VWVLGYRIALIVVGWLAFELADSMSWSAAYLAMSVLMLVGITTVFWAPEPVMREAPPKSLYEAVWLPFRDFFERSGPIMAILILLFVVLYKLPDNLAIGMSTPFLLQIGFSEADIGRAVGLVGLIATIAGSLASGAVVGRIGLNRSLWVVLILQSISQIGYFALALHGPSYPFMISAVIAENFVYGMVGTVFIAYLMALCSRRFSATQYALLSSLMAVSRDLLIAPAGSVVESVGWPNFFLIALATGIPPLLMLPVLAPWNWEHPRGAATHTGEVTDDPAPPPAADKR